VMVTRGSLRTRFRKTGEGIFGYHAPATHGDEVCASCAAARYAPRSGWMLESRETEHRRFVASHPYRRAVGDGKRAGCCSDGGPCRLGAGSTRPISHLDNVRWLIVRFTLPDDGKDQETMSHRLAAAYDRVHSAVNYRLRTFAGGRLAASCRPTSIAILLTERCNARCLHCDIWKNRGKESTPSVDQWKAALRDLRRWLGRVHVVFTGGEALLMPFAPEVVAYASSLGLLVEHLTHGYWLDQSRIEKMAMGRPWRITISCDGIGATHDKIRGREHFFDTVETTIQTLLRLRREHGLGYTIRLKTVIMEHNLHDVANIARYARTHGLEVFYQPIEQNYNTPEDPRWFEHSDNWPKDRERAVAAVGELIELKR